MLHDQEAVCKACPCGSTQPFNLCCEPLIGGKKNAATAEALMRSRYTAFSLGAIDYLIDTTAPEMRRPDDAAVLNEQTKATIWSSLRVVAKQAGENDDTNGTVEFKASFTAGDETGVLHETSRFRQDGGQWFYVDGDVEVMLTD
ncbi:YchJ family protein [Pontibacter sp. JAM-7]|uniref:YchJ family protein n=1 Tax=Pontibacter sp. JAM-7 TaxID=3366581 RepID=UPI003AF78733